MAIDTTTPRTRRAILFGGIAAAAAATLGRAQPAGAHDPDDVRRGRSNTATHRTGITNTATDGSAFAGHANGSGTGVSGTSPAGYGVVGSSRTGYGIRGISESGFGLHGTSDTGHGLLRWQRLGHWGLRRQRVELRGPRRKRLEHGGLRLQRLYYPARGGRLFIPRQHRPSGLQRRGSIFASQPGQDGCFRLRRHGRGFRRGSRPFADWARGSVRWQAGPAAAVAFGGFHPSRIRPAR